MRFTFPVLLPCACVFFLLLTPLVASSTLYGTSSSGASSAGTGSSSSPSSGPWEGSYTLGYPCPSACCCPTAQPGGGESIVSIIQSGNTLYFSFSISGPACPLGATTLGGVGNLGSPSQSVFSFAPQFSSTPEDSMSKSKSPPRLVASLDGADEWMMSASSSFSAVTVYNATADPDGLGACVWYLEKSTSSSSSGSNPSSTSGYTSATTSATTASSTGDSSSTGEFTSSSNDDFYSPTTSTRWGFAALALGVALFTAIAIAVLLQRFRAARSHLRPSPPAAKYNSLNNNNISNINAPPPSYGTVAASHPPSAHIHP